MPLARLGRGESSTVVYTIASTVNKARLMYWEFCDVSEQPTQRKPFVSNTAEDSGESAITPGCWAYLKWFYAV